MTMPTAVLNGRAHDAGVADDDADPGARPRRRVSNAEYKLAILPEYDRGEHLVARTVAESVVDLLEVVQVEYRDGQRGDGAVPYVSG